MNILIIGNGGREHALAWKVAASNRCDKLFVAPGNAGTGTIAENVAIQPEEFDKIAAFIRTENIQMVIIGPEGPLVSGLQNFLLAEDGLEDLMVIGPGEDGAMLEGSKDFSKEFMLRHKIPTAKSRSFIDTDLDLALSYIETCGLPIVLKADGLAAGKGVIICNEHSEAKKNMKEMLAGKFGDASKKVLVEEFLKGIELSVFIITDGESYKILPEAKDYKRIGEKDTGLNTGGMGAVSPVVFADAAFMEKVEKQIIKPTLQGLKKDNINYQGFIFIGLMNDGGDPYVIEYNVRMGDPETQSVMARIKSDIVELFEAVANGELNEYDLEIDNRSVITVVAVSGGYPEEYEKGLEINGLSSGEDVMIFHAGTSELQGRVVTSGGRVLAATALGDDLKSAREKAYKTLQKISWKDMYFRKDIGKDLISFIEKV
jgi:phosphoribosylamine--glycine ligase